MARHVSKVFEVFIAAAATESAWVEADTVYGDADRLVCMAPATEEAHAYTIEVTDDSSGTPVVRTLQKNDLTAAGADIAVPAAGKAFEMNEILGCVAFRIKSDGAITTQAQATFTFTKQWD